MTLPFEQRWIDKQRHCGLDDFEFEMVACGDDTLPSEAAPCLTFDQAAQPVPLWEVFGSPDQWSAEGRERVAAFRMIGSEGAGNPLCIEQPGGAVVMLDHEDGFRTRQFVNGSVRQLAECLLAYMGERKPEAFQATVQAIDPEAMVEGTFWWYEAQGLGA